MHHIFEIKDKTNRRIRLTVERWRHLSKHPDVLNKLSSIQETLKKPLKITPYVLDESINYYYTYFKARKTAKYLRVVVKYLNGDGFLITAYFVDKIQ